jgi:hypothetical protein
MGGLWRKADESFEEKEQRPESFLKNKNTDESFEGKKNLKACWKPKMLKNRNIDDILKKKIETWKLVKE